MDHNVLCKWIHLTSAYCDTVSYQRENAGATEKMLMLPITNKPSVLTWDRMDSKISREEH